jgi:hypothetical protein
MIPDMIGEKYRIGDKIKSGNFIEIYKGSALYIRGNLWARN